MNKCEVDKLQQRYPFPVVYNYRPVELRKLFSCMLLGFTLKNKYVFIFYFTIKEQKHCSEKRLKAVSMNASTNYRLVH
jgi:hypothetical protein